MHFVGAVDPEEPLVVPELLLLGLPLTTVLPLVMVPLEVVTEVLVEALVLTIPLSPSSPSLPPSLLCCACLFR